jgi:hypothetical protein
VRREHARAGRRALGAVAWEDDDPKNAACEDHEEAREACRRASLRTLPGRCGISRKAARSRCQSDLNELYAREGAVVAALNASSIHSRPQSGGAPNRCCDSLGTRRHVFIDKFHTLYPCKKCEWGVARGYRPRKAILMCVGSSKTKKTLWFSSSSKGIKESNGHTAIN